MNQLRIAYVSNLSIHFAKAHGIQMMKMCQTMAVEGHHVHLITPRCERRSGQRDDTAGLDEDYGITHPFPVLELGQRGIFSRTRFQYGAALWSHRHGVDLVYTRDVSTAAVTSLLGIPTFLEAHQLPGGRIGPWYFRVALAGSGFKKLVVITEGLLHLLEQVYPRSIRDKEIVVAADGVDLERYERLPAAAEAAKQLGADPDRFRVGYTGNLYKGRGLELILELAKSFSDVDFWIVGGHPSDVDEWQAHARSAGACNIRFWGFISNALLPKYQAACHVLLMPFAHNVAVSGNKGDTSAVMSPMKMFEYMATGRLIISSDMPVLREILGEHNAALCPPDDVAAWVNALQRAQEDEVWRKTLGARARLDVRKYSWENRVRRILGSNMGCTC